MSPFLLVLQLFEDNVGLVQSISFFFFFFVQFIPNVQGSRYGSSFSRMAALVPIKISPRRATFYKLQNLDNEILTQIGLQRNGTE